MTDYLILIRVRQIGWRSPGPSQGNGFDELVNAAFTIMQSSRALASEQITIMWLIKHSLPNGMRHAGPQELIRRNGHRPLLFRCTPRRTTFCLGSSTLSEWALFTSFLVILFGLWVGYYAMR